jgi:hypothetical protein
MVGSAHSTGYWLPTRVKSGVSAALRFPQIQPYAGEFERGRPACLDALNPRETRGARIAFNGGAGGRYPQIRVLPPPGKSQPTSIYRLPLRLLQINPQPTRLSKNSML